MSERRRELRLDHEDRRQPPSARRKSPRARGKRPADKPRRISSWQRRLGLAVLPWALVFAIWRAIAVSAVFGYFALTLPEMGDLPSAERPPTTTLGSSAGTRIATPCDMYSNP